MAIKRKDLTPDQANLIRFFMQNKGKWISFMAKKDVRVLKKAYNIDKLTKYYMTYDTKYDGLAMLAQGEEKKKIIRMTIRQIDRWFVLSDAVKKAAKLAFLKEENKPEGEKE